MASSIFQPDGDGYLPTEAALSPWSEAALHGGAPAMLLAREIERFPSDEPMFVTRLTIELLRPTGRERLTARSELIRPGRKVQLVVAELLRGEVTVARATAVRIRQGGVEVPAEAEPAPYDPPERLTEWRPSGTYREGAAFHLDGVDIRMRGDVDRLGPHWAWFRLKLPLLPGEPVSGLQRICAAADFPNGISNVVNPREISYVNPDLTIYIHRLPVDEWVLLDAHSWLESNGVGFAEGALHDRRGRLGRSLQSLLVEPR